MCSASSVTQKVTHNSSVLKKRYASQRLEQTAYPVSGFHSQSALASSQLARAIASRSGTPAETYVAYGLTQKLFEACSTQAEYTIPQLNKKGGQVPKTDAGEDLGVGEGWWYKGQFTFTFGGINLISY